MAQSKDDWPARILVVDDEPHIRQPVARALDLAGYHVQEAASGHQALTALEHACFDLMVLDMRMPGLDGVEVMRRARQICPGLLIVILTGHATVESAVAAVKSDAVDYLIKPASIHDIVASVGAALQAHAEQLASQRLLHTISEAVDTLRRRETPASAAASAPPPPVPPRERFLCVGPVTLDRQKRLVIVSGAPDRTAEITEGEMAILSSLMECPDQALACRQLARAALGYDLDEREARSVVRPYISRLRRKIEADPNDPQMIRAMRGRGYLFVPPSPST